MPNMYNSIEFRRLCYDILNLPNLNIYASIYIIEIVKFIEYIKLNIYQSQPKKIF